MEIDILKEAKNVFDIEIAELEKLKSKLGDDFQKLVRMILELKNNNKVVVTGIGKSGIIGKKITATLASTGTTAVFINAAEALHGDLGMISDGDVVIAISNSGNSDEVLSILAPICRTYDKCGSGKGSVSIGTGSDEFDYSDTCNRRCPCRMPYEIKEFYRERLC